MKNLYTQRFNPDPKWWMDGYHDYNKYFVGFIHMLNDLWGDWNTYADKKKWNMIEIGSYMGESILLFNSIGIFNEIHSIEPFEGHEQHMVDYGYDWDFVKEEFKTNTRLCKNIIQYEDYSYNVVDNFEDNSIDFIYIDGDHSYAGVKRDVELFIPKVKNGGFIGGHDYDHQEWMGVCDGVDDALHVKPTKTYLDMIWIKKIVK